MSVGTKKISELAEFTGTLTGSEFATIISGGVNYKVKTQKIIAPVTFCEQIIISVVNNSGNTIDALKPVYCDGILTDTFTINLGDNSESLKSKIIGVTKESVGDSLTTNIIQFGIIENVDTSLLSEGWVYLDTAGGLTNTEPTAIGSYKVVIGYCVISAEETGVFFVFPMNFGKIERFEGTATIAKATSNSPIILGADTKAGYTIDITAIRGTRKRKEQVQVLTGVGTISQGYITYPNTETEDCGFTYSHDTNGGNARLLITTDNSDVNDTLITYTIL